MDSFLTSFLEAPRSVKRIVTLLFDILALSLSAGVSYWFVSEFTLNLSSTEIALIFVSNIFSILIFIRLGFYRAILRYIGFRSIYVIFTGSFLSTVFFTVTLLITSENVPVVQPLIYAMLLLMMVGGSRLAVKGYINRVSNKSISKVAIYGAGAAGRQLASALRFGDRYRTVLFIDDNKSLHDSEIDGIKVVGVNSLSKEIKVKQLTHIFMALPSASHARRNEILLALEPYPVKVKTIAGLEDIVSGKVSIEELKDVEIEDLLGRDSVSPDSKLLKSCITDKVVMVTGAGGSIGSELCRQIVTLKPKALLLYELSEYGLYAIERELRNVIKNNDLEVELYALLGSVQHKRRLRKCMEQFSVQTVYHAAAYKHVPIVEHNVVEGIRNNVFGTYHAAEAALQAGVEKFVLISTDKAVRPTNIMGASKRFAELVLQSIALKSDKTVFTMVRFGNVLGSSGSVVPLFREQIRKGGPVTVTHPDIIRYFMTIPEAAQLVIQAGAMGQGGDVFVLDMGEPVKIAALAERMIHLMGRTVKTANNTTGDIEIQYSGLRPGEKLFEELLIGENVEGTEHSRIMRAKEEHLSWEDTKAALKVLDELCDSMDCEGIVQLLLRVPTGYNPQHAVCDLLWDNSDLNKEGAKVVQFKTLS